ncbi:MAG TPA: FHA domain-containing protein [Candidatus Ozemobacteraceae bacterium]|nr:FHA domain-containing protein [Candidatus Ozemobacteraceae bacterium]
MACAWAQTLSAPEQAEPGSMFVVDVALPPAGGGVTRLSFEPGSVQFMGLVVPTPDVQLVGDSIIEFSAGAGSSGRHQVKFLAFPNASAAVFDFVPAVAGQRRTVALVAKSEEKRYHWHILAAGLILLAVAWGFWRYQKKNPGLMSTRSLFLNFEELQKAREQFFAARPGESGSPATPPTPERPVQAATPPEPPVTSPTPPMELPVAPLEAGNKTGEMPAVPESDLRTLEMPKQPVSGSSVAEAAPMAEGEALQGRTPTHEMPATTQPDVNKTRVGEAPVPAEQPLPGAAGPLPASSGANAGKTVVRSDLSGKRPVTVEPELFVRLTDANGRIHEGKGREVLIGRSPECTIIMTAAEVSRKHLLIRREAGRLVAVPQTSSNTTEINGIRIQGASTIDAEATITLGGTPFSITITG